MTLKGRDLLTLADFTTQEVRSVIDRARQHKTLLSQSATNRPKQLADRAVAVILLKPSLRTRVSFEVAIAQLGGQAINLGPESAFTRDESVHDTVKTLEGYVSCIVLRTFEQTHIEEVAGHASIPVVNALTDDYHPCQVLADLLTLEEHFGKLDGLHLAYVGDGNNMANTLMIGAAHVGMHAKLACPAGFEPLQAATQVARGIAENTGSSIEVIQDPREAVAGANVVITDTWTSMGSEEEHDYRVQQFHGYTVDAQLMALAAPDAVFMHCLPAHRGEEVTAEVIDGSQSIVFAEAANRMHAQKSLLSLLIG